MTPREARLWLQLRALRPQGLHFRRQVPIGKFVVDFACLRAGIVVELDGAQHASSKGSQADATRDATLAALGFRVIRFWNAEIDENIGDVVETIFAACAGEKTR